MRAGYFSGAPGIAASGLVWLAAAATALASSPQHAIWVLLIGGAFIHPASIGLAKALGRSGRHGKGNPLGGLAIEGTFWLLAGIAIAYGMQALKPEWFFPAMLLLIGGRYLTFQTLYGLRIYWLLGAVLCISGIAIVLARMPVVTGALTGAAIELAFCAVVFVQAKRRPN